MSDDPILTLAIIALTCAPVLAAPATNSLPHPEKFAAFAKENLSRLPDGQTYLGRPMLKTLGTSIDERPIASALDAKTWFRQSLPAAMLFVVEQPPRVWENQITTKNPFVSTLQDAGYEMPEATSLWTVFLSMPGPYDYDPSVRDHICSSLFARDRLTIIVAGNATASLSCVDDAAYHLRGEQISFATYAKIPASEQTRQADELFVTTLQACATEGLIDAAAKQCAQRQFDELQAQGVAAH